MIKAIQNIVRLDTWLFLHIFERSGRTLLKRFFYAVSRLADGYVYAACALVIALVDRQRGIDFLGAGLLAYSFKVVLYLIIKRRIRRRRPFDSIAGINFLIQPPDKFSFPSGHTMGAFVFAGLVGAFYPGFDAPMMIAASLVGFSRIYLGVHYPGDVLAGSLLGLLCAEFGLIFFA